ncbi:hypothetical protein ACQCSX_21945 (plasmid) [Pseudarthrobacter sp. P1]|uniref:hypothetical protein n=1 Tax=Pseudarthrobacter sp. P1 TaxID=3418418 RepID=UPI003CFAA7DA
MPPRLQPVTAKTVALRLELHPGTITLDTVKTIFDQLADGAAADGNHALRLEARDAAAAVQDLIDTPEPRGLVASARLIGDIDTMVQVSEDLRILTAEAYDLLYGRTAQATVALEILMAFAAQLEAADLELRTGTRAA